MLNHLLAKQRDIFSTGEGSVEWSRLMNFYDRNSSFLNEFPEIERIIVQDATSRLESFPDHLRVATSQHVRDAINSEPNRSLQFARALDIDIDQARDFKDEEIAVAIRQLPHLTCMAFGFHPRPPIFSAMNERDEPVRSLFVRTKVRPAFMDQSFLTHLERFYLTREFRYGRNSEFPGFIHNLNRNELLANVRDARLALNNGDHDTTDIDLENLLDSPLFCGLERLELPGMGVFRSQNNVERFFGSETVAGVNHLGIPVRHLAVVEALAEKSSGGIGVALSSLAVSNLGAVEYKAFPADTTISVDHLSIFERQQGPIMRKVGFSCLDEFFTETKTLTLDTNFDFNFDGFFERNPDLCEIKLVDLKTEVVEKCLKAIRKCGRPIRLTLVGLYGKHPRFFLGLLDDETLRNLEYLDISNLRFRYSLRPGNRGQSMCYQNFRELLYKIMKLDCGTILVIREDRIHNIYTEMRDVLSASSVKILEV